MVSHLKFCYTIELAQHDLEKHWSGEFSYPLSEFFFYHCCERDSPSYGSSELNEETGGFLSKTTTSYLLLAKQRSVFIPGEKGHSILVAFLQEFEREEKRFFSRLSVSFPWNARYAGYRTHNIPHSIY